jgi:hypothetical protein
MKIETSYEAWREQRSRREPSDGFADRIMQQVELLPMPAAGESTASSNRWQGLARIVLCAAAVVAALFRVAELLSAFVATGIEN